MVEEGRAPTDEELAEFTGLSPEKVGKIRMYTEGTLSLDRPVGKGDDRDDRFSDFPADSRTAIPLAEVLKELQGEELYAAIGELPEREKEILKQRYGLEDGRPRTLKEVGKFFNLIRERIRQLESDALDELKDPKIKEKLRPYRRFLENENQGSEVIVF